MRRPFVLLCLLVLIDINFGKPQQQQQQQNAPSQLDQPENLKNLVDSIFTTASPPVRSGGFAQIVTPEPIGLEPTSSPQILQTDDGNKCICVPYYLCDPTNNTIRTDGEFDGFGLIDIRFDPMSCQDVLDVCCKESQTQTEPINPKPVSEKPGRPKGCGIRNVGGIDFQITGNTNNEAGFGEFPWTVALLTVPSEQCLCGGSLIHPNVVLTGNHCVRRIRPNELKVRAGEWDTQTTKERLPYQERRITEIVGHPMYDPKTLDYDFALLVLDSPFDLADHINVVCLPPQNYVSTSPSCLASGWGKDIFGKAGKYSVIMKRVPLPIVPNGQCETALQKTRLGQYFRLKDTFICAGGEPGVDTCEGDGGAPLVCPVGLEAENRYSQSGIVAWGIGCNEDHPAVYASVAVARSWIDSQMLQRGFDPSVYTY
ncbi:phenoloxidase-activating factor 2-like [Hermetia illucens]|nr:phenoloxidase-activating factor 2-like [Hermetia illucens]XP_037917553.1 phenoloxidase-activating factor 2-like [Hermetia illucens]XP_037917554.1 phenoloxidase-activating factor 2-like [Hermetia illucens]